METISGMRRATLEEMHTIENDILQRFAGFCADNDITCMLAAGTLLGAVRHKGFIPWDDDVDVMIPRADYERIVSMADELRMAVGLEFRVTNGANDPYPYPYAKVSMPSTLLIEKYEVGEPLGLGIHIDVFPLDGWPSFGPARFIRHAVIGLLFRLVIAKIAPNRRSGARGLLLKSVARGLASVPVSRLSDRITALARKCAFETSESAGIIVWGYQERVPTSAYLPTAPLEFEGLTFLGPRDVDEVLSRVYGDYMELPPVEERVLRHDPLAYVRDVQAES